MTPRTSNDPAAQAAPHHSRKKELGSGMGAARLKFSNELNLMTSIVVIAVLLGRTKPIPGLPGTLVPSMV
jgi:hypothetical protein